MTENRATVSIGRHARFTLTHGDCDLRLPAGLHRFEAVFTRPDFHARAAIDTGMEPVEDFREALTALYEDLSGEAVLQTHEKDLTLEATVNKLGHVFWTGTIGFGYSGGSSTAKYEFWIEDDQTSIPIIVDQLRAIIEEARAEKV